MLRRAPAGAARGGGEGREAATFHAVPRLASSTLAASGRSVQRPLEHPPPGRRKGGGLAAMNASAALGGGGRGGAVRARPAGGAAWRSRASRELARASVRARARARGRGWRRALRLDEGDGVGGAGRRVHDERPAAAGGGGNAPAPLGGAAAPLGPPSPQLMGRPASTALPRATWSCS